MRKATLITALIAVLAGVAVAGPTDTLARILGDAMEHAEGRSMATAQHPRKPYRSLAED
jgi:hypothetical protein